MRMKTARAVAAENNAAQATQEAEEKAAQAAKHVEEMAARAVKEAEAQMVPGIQIDGEGC